MTYVKVDHPERACLWCEETFKPNRKDKEFCCKTHYNYYMRKHKGHSKGNPRTISKRVDLKRRPYRVHLESKCARCGFVPEHNCQLDVDHIDCNHQNNAPENLQTLCANCHRLKTFWERQ